MESAWIQPVLLNPVHQVSMALYHHRCLGSCGNFSGSYTEYFGPGAMMDDAVRDPGIQSQLMDPIRWLTPDGSHPVDPIRWITADDPALYAHAVCACKHLFRVDRTYAPDPDLTCTGSRLHWIPLSLDPTHIGSYSPASHPTKAIIYFQLANEISHGREGVLFPTRLTLPTRPVCNTYNTSHLTTYCT